MRVLRHIAGSKVVIMADHRDDTYVDARLDVRRPGYSQIEFVRSGQVQYHEEVTHVRAPIRLLEIARKERL